MYIAFRLAGATLYRLVCTNKQTATDLPGARARRRGGKRCCRCSQGLRGCRGPRAWPVRVRSPIERGPCQHTLAAAAGADNGQPQPRRHALDDNGQLRWLWVMERCKATEVGDGTSSWTIGASLPRYCILLPPAVSDLLCSKCSSIQWHSTTERHSSSSSGGLMPVT